MGDQDEILDLVDSDDNVIGVIKRSEYYRLETEKLGYVRAVEMFIQNDEGKLWVPTRNLDKKIAPGGLDYSMGGHVSAGETYLQSALRETQEELNLTLTEKDLKFVKKFTPGELPYFRTLYVCHSNTAPDYNPDDFSSAEWLSMEELVRKLDDGAPAKRSLRETAASLASFLDPSAAT